MFIRCVIGRHNVKQHLKVGRSSNVTVYFQPLDYWKICQIHNNVSRKRGITEIRTTTECVGDWKCSRRRHRLWLALYLKVLDSEFLLAGQVYSLSWITFWVSDCSNNTDLNTANHSIDQGRKQISTTISSRSRTRSASRKWLDYTRPLPFIVYKINLNSIYSLFRTRQTLVPKFDEIN